MTTGRRGVRGLRSIAGIQVEGELLVDWKGLRDAEFWVGSWIATDHLVHTSLNGQRLRLRGPGYVWVRGLGVRWRIELRRRGT
jgi:hypothetical protein